MLGFFIYMEENMEFFGFTLFSSLSGGALLAVAAVIFVIGLCLTIKCKQQRRYHRNRC